MASTLSPSVEAIVKIGISHFTSFRLRLVQVIRWDKLFVSHRHAVSTYVEARCYLGPKIIPNLHGKFIPRSRRGGIDTNPHDFLVLKTPTRSSPFFLHKDPRTGWRDDIRKRKK